MFRIGKRVRVSSDNDNDCYDEFRDKTLKVTHIARNTKEHAGYDVSMRGMALYDLEDLKGNQIPCSLYEYELEEI